MSERAKPAANGVPPESPSGTAVEPALPLEVVTSEPDGKPVRVRRPRRPRMRPASEWSSWEDDQLLGLKFSELELPIAGSELEPRTGGAVERARPSAVSLFRPHFWLSDEWFSPDGIPGIAIPFYLAHPRLARLELHQMLEVEGGTHEWCMKILRHEAGHAIENAYQAAPAGAGVASSSAARREPYPEYYTPRPYSKSFVIHLDAWYAQSHPDEDFAETFAVWLRSGVEVARALPGAGRRCGSSSTWTS